MIARELLGTRARLCPSPLSLAFPSCTLVTPTGIFHHYCSHEYGQHHTQREQPERRRNEEVVVNRG